MFARWNRIKSLESRKAEVNQAPRLNDPHLLCLSESELTNLAGLYRDERLRQKAESLKLENCAKLSKLIGLRRAG